MQNIDENKKYKTKAEHSLEDDIHVVRIYGGFGNQLFQYALYMTFKYMGFATYADMEDMENGECPRNYQLGFVGIDLRRASKECVKKLFSGNKVTKAIVKRIGKKTYYRRRDLVYDNSVFDAKIGYFDGYWQSEKYFKKYADRIKDTIIFPPISEKDSKSVELNEAILKSKNSVSVHVRLGDYVDASNIYGGICTAEYYKEATELIKRNIEQRGEEHPVFVVFSNDIEQAKSILDYDDFIFFEGHSEDLGYIDMGLMSKCKHHIIANSSFSWWGAYLGQYDGSITVAPSEWIRGEKGQDIIPSDWIRL